MQAALTYQAIAPTGLLGTSVNTVLAAQYENVILGDRARSDHSAAADWQLERHRLPSSSPVQITVAGQTVTPQFVGLVDRDSTIITLQIPQVTNGTASITLTVNGVDAASALVPIRVRIRRSGDRHNRNPKAAWPGRSITSLTRQARTTIWASRTM